MGVGQIHTHMQINIDCTDFIGNHILIMVPVIANGVSHFLVNSFSIGTDRCNMPLVVVYHPFSNYEFLYKIQKILKAFDDQ